MANAESENFRREFCPLSLAVALFVGICVFGALLVTNSLIHGSKRQVQSEFGYRRTKCDPEICGQQCYSNYYMNAWCENFTCYCDNDCLRHRNLYPWDDTARTCSDICELKHGPCTGSGCAGDTYWANSTRAEYELYHKVSLLFEPKLIRHVTEYYFFNSTACFCFDNGTEHKNEEATTVAPTAWDDSQPEWKFWLSLNPIKSREDSDENKYGGLPPKPPKYKMWDRSNSRSSEIESSESDNRPSCETAKDSGHGSRSATKPHTRWFRGKKSRRKIHRIKKGQSSSNSRLSSGSSSSEVDQGKVPKKGRRNRKSRSRRRW